MSKLFEHSLFDEKRMSLYSNQALSSNQLPLSKATRKACIQYNKQNIGFESNRYSEDLKKNSNTENFRKKGERSCEHNEILNIKKQNAKKNREMNREKERQMDNMKKKFQQEKLEIVQKYEAILQEKQEYIKMLEEILPLKQTTANHQLSSHTKQPSIQKSPSIEIPTDLENKQKTSRPNTSSSLKQTLRSQTLYRHQNNILDQIGFSIEKIDDIPHHNRGLKNQTMKFTNLTKNQQENQLTHSRKSLQFGYRCSSGSKHKLNPASRPIINIQ